ncbi:MAG: hypothetical protein C4292_01075 [Nitrososphaera sp.]
MAGNGNDENNNGNSGSRGTCSVCGSRFAQKNCYFCQKRVCNSCIIPDDVAGSTTTIKCIACHRKGVNKISFLSVMRRNKFVLAVIACFWIFTVFPLPFLNLTGYRADVLVTILQPVLIAAGLMTIPFVFMMMAWQRRAPKQD